jgi:phosphatidate cytidylyltransferase
VLKLRVATSIVMALVLVGVLFYLPPKSMTVFFAVLVLAAAWEWSKLAGLKGAFGKSIFTFVCALSMLVMVWYCNLFTEQMNWTRVRDILGAGCVWWCIALLWVKSFPRSAVLWGSVFVRIVMGLMTLLPAWLALAYLSFQAQNIALILILVALVASADIGAYFVGRTWGKSKLAPSVSPGKSWAGFWGGLACSSLLAVIVWVLLPITLTLLQVVVIAVVTALASVLGDLVESMVKRQQGVKDSGVILPGHGGMMDRLDSLTAASPVFTLCLILTGW